MYTSLFRADKGVGKTAGGGGGGMPVIKEYRAFEEGAAATAETLYSRRLFSQQIKMMFCKFDVERKRECSGL